MYFEGKSKIKDFVDTLAEKVRLAGWTVTKIPIGIGGNFVTSATSAVPFTFSSDITNWVNATNCFNDDYASKSVTAGSYAHFTVDTGEGKGFVINGMAYTSSNHPTYNAMTPDTFQLFGSDDKTTWVELTDKTAINITEYRQRVTMFSDNTTDYRYYQIRLYNDTDASKAIYPQLIEFLQPVADTLYYEYVCESAGKSGVDDIIVTLSTTKTKTSVANLFGYSILKSFDRTTHAMSCRSIGFSRFYNITSEYSTENSISYNVSINEDRILIANCTDSYVTNFANNVTYLGLMSRYSAETGNGAVCRMSTIDNLYSNAVCTLSNASGYNYGKGIVLWVYPTKSPSLWGNNVFMSPTFIEMENEGVRGVLDGLYLTKIDGMVHGDEVVIGASRYRFILTTAYGNNALPTRGVLISIE